MLIKQTLLIGKGKGVTKIQHHNIITTRIALSNKMDNNTHSSTITKSINFQGVDFEYFDGDPNSNFESWSSKLSHTFNFLKWSDQKKGDLVPILLTSRAKQVFDNIPTEHKSCYKSIMKELSEKFSFQNKPLLHGSLLLDRVQKPGEPVSSYTGAMLEIFTKLGITKDTECLIHFCNGFRPEIRREVLMKCPKTVHEAEQIALVTEGTMDVDNLELRQKIENILETVTKNMNTTEKHTKESSSNTCTTTLNDVNLSINEKR